MRIGIDLDNTIINYDTAFHAAAVAQSLVPADLPATKRAVKAHLDDIAWQQLQGYVYGRGIAAATLYDGVVDFLTLCKRKGWEVVIVSHKTEFGHFDATRCNLRKAARDWLDAQGFFSAPDWRIAEDAVYFESTRAEKVTRIAALSCDVFIDDLLEVFEEPHFPATTRPLLFRAEAAHGIAHYADWAAIHRALASNVMDAR